jgi:hypothetical protein
MVPRSFAIPSLGDFASHFVTNYPLEVSLLAQ